jgi:hypothetical protein
MMERGWREENKAETARAEASSIGANFNKGIGHVGPPKALEK